MFEVFYHDVTNPYIWGFILLLSCRAIYSCIKKKDFVHTAAFLAVIVISAYFTASGLGVLPHGFEEELFNAAN